MSDERVDVSFLVTEVATLDVVLELACPPSTGGIGELERPQEIQCLAGSLSHKSKTGSVHGSTYLFEVRASGEDVMNEIFDGEDIILSKRRLDDADVCERGTLLPYPRL